MDSSHPPEDVGQSEKVAQKLDLNKPCKIINVNFQGVKKTRPTLLAKIVSDIFPSTTLIDFLARYVQVKENLMSLNAFSKIDIEVNPATSQNTLDANKDEENYEVTFLVEERGYITASLQTAVDNHSTHINLSLGLPNLTGIGDLLSLSSKFNKRFYYGEYRYSIPLMPWRKLWAPKYSICYSKYQWDSQPSGYDQEDKALINQVEFFSLNQLKHTISFENIWRFIRSSPSVQTPIEIIEQSGHSIKSSIKHEMTFDNRLSGEHFPSDGILAKLTNELTTNLVNGGVKFNKHEINLQANGLLLPKYDLLCQFNLLAGTILKPQKIYICDKFFAGGPLTVRGFKFQGLGPNINGFPLGDLSYLSSGIHLYSILPFTKPSSQINNFVRPHIFINTGTIGSINDLWRISSRDNMKREINRFKESLRYSCGFGLVMYFMALRLEINYCIPLVFKNSDLAQRGMQWGFGLTYT